MEKTQNMAALHPVRLATEPPLEDNQNYFLYRGRVYATNADGDAITLIHPKHELTAPIIIYDDHVLVQYNTSGHLASVERAAEETITHAAGKFIRLSSDGTYLLICEKAQDVDKAKEAEEEETKEEKEAEEEKEAKKEYPTKPHQLVFLRENNQPLSTTYFDVFMNKSFLLVTNYKNNCVDVYDRRPHDPVSQTVFLYSVPIPKPVRILSFGRNMVHVLSEDSTYFIYDSFKKRMIMSWKIPFVFTQLTSNGQEVFLLDEESKLHTYKLTQNPHVRGYSSSSTQQQFKNRGPPPVPPKSVWKTIR